MEVNPNSTLLTDFADDNLAILNNPVTMSDFISIRDNYQTMDLDQLKNAYTRITTDLANLQGAAELDKIKAKFKDDPKIF